MRLLDTAFRTDFNTVRINVNNTLQHELAKCKLVYENKKEGKTVLTEAVFKNKARADVLILDDFRVIEVLYSEKEKEALSKLGYYPPELDLVFRKTEEVLKWDDL